jgi:hypothetical protein
VQIRALAGKSSGSVTGKLAFTVSNFLVAPGKGLDTTLPVEITVRPAR